MKPQYLHAATVVLSVIFVALAFAQDELVIEEPPLPEEPQMLEEEVQMVGTISLSDSGWSDPTVGTWNPSTLTGTLNQNIKQSIQIVSDEITLDGAEHTLTGSGSGYGVYLSERTGVTIQNLNIQGFRIGIQLYYSSANTLTGNICSNNSWHGIRLVGSSGYNTLTGNICSNNLYHGILLIRSSYNNLTGNITNSNNYMGIRLRESSNNNTLTDNTTSNNHHGIQLRNCSNNAVIDNTVSSNDNLGIWLFYYCSANTVTGNTVSSNIRHGIILDHYCSKNILSDNTSSNNWHGIVLYINCSNNAVTGNTAKSNSYGIRLSASNDNQIYNNNVISNTTQAQVDGDSSGNVFNLDKPNGGNYWSDHTGPDANGDGFVDNPYVFTGGQDNLPWAAPDGWGCRDPQEMIQELADQVLSLNLQHGISHSLDAKLDAALQALDDINENNDIAAINTLEAFINAVQAQSDSKIPETDAEALIAKAQKIIDCLRGI